MSDPEIGKTAYTKRLDSIRDQFGIIMDTLQKLNDNEPGPRESLALRMTAMSAVIQGVDDVLALERFGRVFKETGELDPELLKGRQK